MLLASLISDSLKTGDRCLHLVSREPCFVAFGKLYQRVSLVFLLLRLLIGHLSTRQHPNGFLDQHHFRYTYPE
jgi:hypothetical protein